MTNKPGEVLHFRVSTYNQSGVLANPTAFTATIYRNGTLDAAVTPAGMASSGGVTSFNVTVPASYAQNDGFSVDVDATCDSKRGVAVLYRARIDTKRIGELVDAAAAPTATVNAVAVRTEMDANSTKLARLPTILATGDAQGRVTVVANQDKTGYGLAALDSMVQHSGTAQAGAANSITLASPASAVTDFYKGSIIKLYGGTGAGQSPRAVTSYNGTTKVVSVGRAFAVTPDSTTLYAVLSDQSPVLDSNLAVTIGTNSDKTGTVLAITEHTAIVTDTQTALTNQGYTTTRAPFLDTLNGLVAAIWGATARTLTAFGFTVNTNANTVETGMAADYARRTGDYATPTNVTAAQDVITTAITAKAVTPVTDVSALATSAQIVAARDIVTTAITAKAVTPVTDVAAALVAYNTARVSDVAVTISSSLTTPQATQLTQAAADAAATIARLAAQVPGTAAVVVLPAPTATGKRLVRVDLTAWGVGSDSVASVAVSVMLSLPIGVIAAKVGAEYVVSGQMWKKLTDSVGIADFELLPTSAMLPTGATYEFAVGDQAFCKVALPAGASVSLTDLV